MSAISSPGAPTQATIVPASTVSPGSHSCLRIVPDADASTSSVALSVSISAKIVPDFTLENCPAPHVLVIPGGAGTRPLLQMPALHEWLRTRARHCEIILSVCTGALVLARAGLLDGLRATTHHQCLDELRAISSAVEVVESERFVDNGKIVTAAGISAGIDASLHVIERLTGRNVADATAAYMEYRRT